MNVSRRKTHPDEFGIRTEAHDTTRSFNTVSMMLWRVWG